MVNFKGVGLYLSSKCFCIIRKSVSLIPSTGERKKSKFTAAYNANTLEADAGGSRVQGQPGLHLKTLSQNSTKKVLIYSI
jgi:hypothetical protein